MKTALDHWFTGKHNWALLFACFGLLALNACATLQMASTWQRTSAEVQHAGIACDEDQDWAYINDGNVLLAADNDSSTMRIKVRFRTADVQWARNCAMTGLTVWLDATGKQKKNFGICIAAGPSLERRTSWAERQGNDSESLEADGTESDFSRRPRLDGALTIIYPDHRVAAPADGSLGPSAGFDTMSGVCTYSLSVPITALSDTRMGLKVAPGASVSVGLTTGPSDEERAAMRQRWQHSPDQGGGEDPGQGEGGEGWGRGGGGEMHGGGDGMGGGRHFRGGSGHGGSAMTMENPEAWIGLQLARKPPQ